MPQARLRQSDPDEIFPWKFRRRLTDVRDEGE
jgi:hypothetical protein